jgi:hypothetical protein
MTADDSRPSGCTGYTPFEEELVQAMNEFANTAETPRFDTAAIVRTSRRKRATAITGVAAALVVVGGGTALAAGVTQGTHTAKPAAVSHAAAADDTTALVALPNGKNLAIHLGGTDPESARNLALKAGLVPEFAKTSCDNGKPTSVVAVAPHSPAVLHHGDTIKISLCA